jgi:hypothetical protein
MEGKMVNVWNFICLLLVIAIFVFLVVHPLNCLRDATTSSLLSLFHCSADYISIAQALGFH